MPATRAASTSAATRVPELVLALALDWLVGEPPNMLHPVAWFGSWMRAVEQRLPRGGPARELLSGAVLAAVGLTTAAVPALAFERRQRRGRLLGLMLGAGLLKLSFAWRALIGAGERVRAELEAGNLEEARRAVGMIVSRDTAGLDQALIAAAAIESLAENASDSLVAPLLYYACFGLPGACVYRAANTLDAMFGYRGSYEHLGKAAAKIDDLLNLVPARLSGALIALAAPLGAGATRPAWEAMRRDHARTASPNAGYPMSAMAGALGVRLEKVGHYRLNAAGRAPDAADLGRAARIINGALGLATLLSVALHWLCRMLSTKGRGRYASSAAR